ncbi:type VI secretion system-associated FHA domain protein TagH [Jannaschia pohangensis]|uniref:FHA domain protein n=1 Tax=Jannaschia pohangensis TaxID=390807 RepID=A0A1I3UKS8_9RHOB|nr:type VI secretion system-associated FHA domain protein TagH [Jannaschia pohangensis]SFJ83680.1 FHA domain protein [Jannaschia pohangensis]
MSLTLKIDNYDRLETGGPTWFALEGRGCQAGRAASMDWVLPDPQRHVSGHHFEVTFDGANYWLRDVSTNGTFLEGERHRMQAPVRLAAGMRFTVGGYIVVVQSGSNVPGASGATPQGQYAPAPDLDDPWASVGGPLEPVNPIPAPPPRHLDDVASDFVPGPPRSSLQVPPQMAPLAPRPVAAPPLMPPHLQSQAPGQPAPAPSQVPMPAPVPPPMQPPMQAPAPPQMPQAAPPPPVAPVAPAGPQAADLVAAFCQGAGLDPKTLSDEDAVKLMAEAGAALRVTATEIMAMLRDRSRVKEFTGGGARTMRSAEGNNPLKFMPDTTQALETLFVARKQGFQFGAEGMASAMSDVRSHQAAVFAALQPALREMLEGLSPEEIEAETKAGIMGRDKGRWAAFVAAWDKKSAAGDNGMLDAFMKAFAKAYGEASNVKF